MLKIKDRLKLNAEKWMDNDIQTDSYEKAAEEGIAHVLKYLEL